MATIAANRLERGQVVQNATFNGTDNGKYTIIGKDYTGKWMVRNLSLQDRPAGTYIYEADTPLTTNEILRLNHGPMGLRQGISRERQEFERIRSEQDARAPPPTAAPQGQPQSDDMDMEGGRRRRRKTKKSKRRQRKTRRKTKKSKRRRGGVEEKDMTTAQLNARIKELEEQLESVTDHEDVIRHVHHGESERASIQAKIQYLKDLVRNK